MASNSQGEAGRRDRKGSNICCWGSTRSPSALSNLGVSLRLNTGWTLLSEAEERGQQLPGNSPSKVPGLHPSHAVSNKIEPRASPREVGTDSKSVPV